MKNPRLNIWFLIFKIVATILLVLHYQSLKAATSKPSSLSLKEAYERALLISHELKIKQSKSRQAQSKVDQAKSAIYPKLNLVGSYTRIDQSQFSATQKATTAADQTSAKVGLTQPLFQGFRDRYLMAIANTNLESEEMQEFLKKQQLYAEVAENYFSVLAFESDLATAQLILKLSSKRLGELENRFRIGRSRKGDLLSASAQKATVESQIALAAAQLLVARQRLAQQTETALDTPLQENSLELPKALEPLQEFIDTIKDRADLAGLKKAIEAADAGISAARAAHYPSLDLFANYYLRRPGALEDSKWDAGVSLSLPLFEGGLTSAKVKEAVELRSEKEQQFLAAQKAAALEVTQLYTNLTAANAQLKSLLLALKASEANFNEQSRDYSLGLISNLDVISSMNAFEEAKRSYDRVRYQSLIDYAQLLAFTGKVP